jgi:hypothetical protein
MVAPTEDTEPRIDRYVGNKVLQTDPDLGFNSGILSSAYGFWKQARNGREFPKKEDLVPLGFPKEVLAHLLLQEIEHEPALRCKWRLIGTHITSVLGRDASGKYWDEIYSDSVLARQFESTNWVLEHRAPLRTVVTSPLEDQYILTSENLDLPVSCDGTVIDMIIIVADYSGSNVRPD